ncbi:MAG TPA: hypothetical protein VIL77_02795 [Gaiellaceae bacterium]
MRTVPTGSRRAAGVVLATVAVLALGYSVRKDVPHSWHLMGAQYSAYAGYTGAQRDRAFGTLIPMPMEIVDYWRSGLRPGDRYWGQHLTNTSDRTIVSLLVGGAVMVPLFVFPRRESEG